jgi:hypothetical protein
MTKPDARKLIFMLLYSPSHSRCVSLGMEDTNLCSRTKNHRATKYHNWQNYKKWETAAGE